jgi:ABC-type Mn2+/Zn2+ transport system ATPase subunit
VRKGEGGRGKAEGRRQKAQKQQLMGYMPQSDEVNWNFPGADAVQG